MWYSRGDQMLLWMWSIKGGFGRGLLAQVVCLSPVPYGDVLDCESALLEYSWQARAWDLSLVISNAEDIYGR